MSGILSQTKISLTSNVSSFIIGFMETRLHVFLARQGVASRRTAEALIGAGRVSVNGKQITTLGFRVTSEDVVAVDGKEVGKKRPHHRYFIFHKPRGVMSTLKDPHAKKTVYDFFKDLPERLVPTGRLDQDSTGLMLMTNDGELVHLLTHPRFQVEKQYQVRLDRPLSEAEIHKLEKGILMDGKRTLPCHIHADERSESLEFILKEGRKREISRMAEAVGARVLALHRQRLGPLELGHLKAGERRELTAKEIQMLWDWTQKKRL
jgi:23S rRNA pseudouridine2605 synthase